MKKCVLCNGELKKHEENSEGYLIKGWKCQDRGETFFPSNEMIRWEILTGRRKAMIQKARKVGDAMIVTLPKEIVMEQNIREDDMIWFEPISEGARIKVIHTK